MDLLQCSIGPRAIRSETRRQNLLDVARRLFTRHGFHGTGVAQIASESGTKVGQIYRDFESKEDIVAAIVEADFIQFLNEADLNAAVAANDIAAVERWISEFFDAGPNAPQEDLLLPEIIAESTRNARISQLLDSIEVRVQSSLLSALATLAPDAADADRRDLADLILGMGMGLHQRRILEPAETAERLATKMRTIVRAEIEALQRVAEPAA